jgi:hypothetical protein
VVKDSRFSPIFLQQKRWQDLVAGIAIKNTQPQTEQSLLLWAMVVLLAIMAFIGLDLATHATFSLLAIPFGIAGSLWSYRRRYLSQHPLTHLVSLLAFVLILTCLGSAFWGQTIEKAKNFLGSDRDLVLPLAVGFLLVAVQVARMWSLCYQRGLGSSVVISVMLMVCTVLIGNNWGFLLVLAIFIGLLVPILMLFYRSTIKLPPIGLSIVPRPRQLTEQHVPWRYLTKIALASVLLGGILSLFAPHLQLPEISWNLPGIDQIVQNLPIQTDPTLTSPNKASTGNSENQDDFGMSKATGDKTSQGNSGTGETKTNLGARGVGTSKIFAQDAGQAGVSGQRNLDSGTSTQPPDGKDSGLMDERLARQAIWHILATADRPLKTRAERQAYLDKYLQEHIKPVSCGNNSANCFKGAYLRQDRFAIGHALQTSDQPQNSLARWNQSELIPSQSYYFAQQQTPPSLLQQLAIPCPVDQQDCYKHRVFQANQQESIRTRNQLLKSIGSINLTEESPRQPQKNPLSTIPPKPSSINSEQLMNFLRIAAIILLLVIGVVWYLWLQGRQEKITKQKDYKFNQLPTIERVYWLMLKELRKSGSVKQNNETEWEFALAKTQPPQTSSISINKLPYPGLLGKLIIEISGDYVAWRYGKKTTNDSSLNHKFERFRKLHNEFYEAEQAKRQVVPGIVSQTKKTFNPVK